MTKGLIIGLATIAVGGTALIGTSMYAATANSTNQAQGLQGGRGMGGPGNMVNSLSGKISTEALTAFQTLTAKHRTIMDAQRNATTKPSTTEIQAQMNAFKTEMDALMVKYPELKTTMPSAQNSGKMGQGMNRGQNGIDTILAGVSDTDKAAIEAIRSKYRAKQGVLRTEEHARIDAIITKYPELKTRFDTLKSNRPQFDGNGTHRKLGGTGSGRSNATNNK